MTKSFRTFKAFKTGLLPAILSLLLFSMLISGVTYSFMTGVSTTPQNIFTVGTVDVDFLGDASVTFVNGCEEYRWTLENVGTKSSYVRVKIVRTEIPVDGETAWALDKAENSDVNSFIERGLSNKWGWVNDYFIGEEIAYTLWAGAGLNDLSKGKKAGIVTMKTLYDEDTEEPQYLQVSYELAHNYTMSEMHLHINPLLPQWPVAPGQFPYRRTFSPEKESFVFLIDLSQIGSFSDGDRLYMAAHAVVAHDSFSQYMYKPSSLGEGCEDRWFWWHEEGDLYGFWYYWDYQADTMQKVVKGDELELCLLMCPLGSDTRPYKFHLEVEAIQSSNEAYKAWPERVWENMPEN